MESQRFCHNCGTKVTIGSRFCSSCGTNLTSLANTPTPPTPPTAKTSQFTPFAAGRDPDDDDKDSYLDRLTHVDIRQNALQVDIIPDRPQGETMGSIVAQVLHGGGAPILEPPRPGQFQGGDKFLAEFAKEGGTLRAKQ